MIALSPTVPCSSTTPSLTGAADKLILPGVGHFDKAMQNLNELELVPVLNEAVLEKKIPILGICLGMQLLTRHSEEGDLPGLGWIDADVKRITFPAGETMQVPHMGWNTIDVKGSSPILDDRYNNCRFYFVHSFQVFCDSAENVLTSTVYGKEFHSAIIRNHIMGVQFHPEKSHKYGYRLLSNFAKWGNEDLENQTKGGQLFSRTDVTEDEELDSAAGEQEDNKVPIRVIPTLLLRENGLVKTEKFKNAKYVGDPRNAVKIFNEKEVDELAILDIDATVKDGEPNYDLLAEIISEAFMPIAYGGAVRTLDQARKLLAMGVEKILLNTAAIEMPELVSQASEHFGAQSVVVVMDISKRGMLKKSNKVCYRSGSKTLKEDPVTFARRMEELGAGEILLQSIDNEGTGNGYDIELIQCITEAVNIPVIASGGASCIEDFAQAVFQGGASAVAAGSMFVFQGRHKAVLISYPKAQALRQALARNNSTN